MCAREIAEGEPARRATPSCQPPYLACQPAPPQCNCSQQQPHRIALHRIASDPVQPHRCICRTLPSAVSPQPAQLSAAQLDSTRLESRGISASLSKKEKKNRSSLRFYANCCNISYARLFMFLAEGEKEQGQGGRREGVT